MRDYEEGRIKFGRGPDNTVYFQVVLRDYLTRCHEASLLESDEIIDLIKESRKVE